jgi:hypothetical protein
VTPPAASGPSPAPPPTITPPSPTAPPTAIGDLTAQHPPLGHGHTLRLRFHAPGAGLLDILVVHGKPQAGTRTALKVHRGSIALGRGQRFTTTSGEITIPVKLSKTAQAMLRRNGRRLGVAVIARYTKPGP